MAKKKNQSLNTLIQALVPYSIKRRIKLTPEYKLHGNMGPALRSFLDRVLPKENQKSS